MEEKDKSKDNIIKGVNKKLRRRNVRVVAVSILVCLFVAAVTYFMLFVRQVPLSASEFTNVRVDKKVQTINQISDEELEYNQLKFYMSDAIQLSVYANRQYYLEKNDDGSTASIYFYYSQTYMQRAEAEKRAKEVREELDRYAEEQGEDYKEETANIYVEGMEGVNSNALVSPTIFRTDLDGALREITKVYYLVYDYDNLNKADFEKAKNGAVLLWEKVD